MKTMRLLTFALTLVACTTAGQPSVASGQEADGRLLEQYTGMMNRLRAELTEQIPGTEDEKQAGELVASGRLDAQLAEFVVLHEAIPEYLAEFARQGRDHERLVEKLLSDPDLMKQMLVADGAKVAKRGGARPAQFGPAMKIYTDIQRASRKARGGVLQRLALAIALEHAVPQHQANPRAGPHAEAPTYVEPVARYMEFEKACLDGDLDKAFPTLSVWELRFVVDGNEPDWARAWGRRMLRAYRPDYVFNGNYAEFAKRVVRYGGGDVKYDRPELQVYQNIVMNGGICGRRAFVGRFILRSFGIPTTARPSRGHGALLYWTPGGWRNKLALGVGRTNTRYGSERDFLASTRARRNRTAYLEVKRAQWVGDVFGEKRRYAGEGDTGSWYGLSLLAQGRIIDDLKSGKLSPTTEDPGDAISLTRNEKAMAIQVADDDGTITYRPDGTVMIPAVAIHEEPESHWVKMKSFDGGTQIYLAGFGPNGRRILRGGSFKSGADFCWSGRRMRGGRFGRYNNWGFRVAASPGSEDPPPEMEVDLGDGVVLELVYIEPGRFIMGGEREKTSGSFEVEELPKHEVVLTQGFYLGKYEVTRDQYAKVMGLGEFRPQKGPPLPVASMNQKDSGVFCERLSEQTGLDARLPTEAEWEYAARAGTETKWFFGDDPARLGEYAWFKDNAGKQVMPVGQKKPNPWGLYDIYGNVWERVEDIHKEGYYAESPKEDPTGPGAGTQSHFEHRVKIDEAGKYALTANVVTMNYKQTLTLLVNGDPTEHTIELPFTLGEWQTSPEVLVDLKEGENTLAFFRKDPPQYGVAIKSFTLKPVR